MPGVNHKSMAKPGVDQRPMLKSRERIVALATLLGHFDAFEALQASDKTAKDLLLRDEKVADLVTKKLVDPSSGKGNDKVCQWLFDTYQLQDIELQAVVLRFIPTLCGVYLAQGFEAVLLALHAAETKSRGGRPLVINIPNLAEPSLYHSPGNSSRTSTSHPQVNLLAPALEPQVAVKSTKRASVVGVALELFWRRIAVMPVKAKLDLCHYVTSWAMQGCSWAQEVDTIAKLAVKSPLGITSVQLEGVQPVPEIGIATTVWEPVPADNQLLEQPLSHTSGEPGKAATTDQLVAQPSSQTSRGEPGEAATTDQNFSDAASTVGAEPCDSPPPDNHKSNQVGEVQCLDEDKEAPRVPLELDVLRPVFKVLGHCLMGPLSTSESKAAAAGAARAVFARASHDLVPEAILASRSLLRLDAAGLRATHTATVALM